VQESSALRPTTSARLFLALWPDAAVRSRLAAQRDALPMPTGARGVSDANLHATLHFIGALDRERIPALWAALAHVQAPPLRLAATNLALWKGGTVVLQLQGDAALTRLHADTGAALLTCGVALDARPFSPHVTLARSAAGVELPSAPHPLDWLATGFALVESSGGSPPTYRVLAAR
jgi:RNA 2',3'-cyclic 3'-phosphodiesterase